MPRPYPVLLADIGGTYARFAVLTSTGARPAPIWKVPTTSFRTPSMPCRSISTNRERHGRAPPASPSPGASPVASRD